MMMLVVTIAVASSLVVAVVVLVVKCVAACRILYFLLSLFASAGSDATAIPRLPAAALVHACMRAQQQRNRTLRIAAASRCEQPLCASECVA